MNGNVTTRFLYDGDALVAEYDANASLLRRHVHWVGADVPLVSYAGSGLSQPSYLHADERGSIVALSAASGMVTAIDSYDEYGIPGTANVGRFQYTGQAWLAELGMYYYKARIYSPTLGRFLQPDPIGYEGGNNLYAYVVDDPVNQSDPTGLDPRIVEHDRQTGATTITVPVILTGPGATSNSLSDMQAVGRQIHAPAGEPAIHVQVVQAQSASGDTQTIDLSPGKDFTHYPNGQGEGNNLRSHQIHIAATTRIDDSYAWTGS